MIITDNEITIYDKNIKEKKEYYIKELLIDEFINATKKITNNEIKELELEVQKLEKSKSELLSKLLSTYEKEFNIICIDNVNSIIQIDDFTFSFDIEAKEIDDEILEKINTNNKDKIFIENYELPF